MSVKYECNVRFRKMSIFAICCLRKRYILFIILLNTVISFQTSTPLLITIFPREQEEAKILPKWRWLLFLDTGVCSRFDLVSFAQFSQSFSRDNGRIRRETRTIRPRGRRAARSVGGKRSRRIFSPTICTLRAKIARQSPSCARSSATFHPPAVRRLTVRGPPPSPLARRLSCISTRNFPFFFIILFIFLANHSDPAAVCLSMQMQRVGASCSPVSSDSVSPTPSLRVHFTIPASTSPGPFRLLFLRRVSEYY